MSDQKNGAWPFPVAEVEGGLDLAAIFGNEPSGGDVNPFEAPAEQEAKAAAELTAEPQSEAQPAPQSEPEAIAAPAQADPQQVSTPKPEPAKKAPATKAQKPSEPAAEDEGINLIAAAFDQKEEEDTKQGLLEKLPVFSYGGAREDITDSSMTFEELRIAKADDFPELAEGKRVSWTVEYGKITKAIKDPKAATIQSIKSEIELSKEFLDSLKKAKDKNPDCLVKPKVTAQSKGIAAYKGVFSSLEEARASDKTICLFPGGDGRIYEMRKSELGEIIVPKDNVVEFPQIRAGFTPALPRIPMFTLSQIISFFRCYMNEREEFEALAHILWDKELEQFVVHIPEQEVSKARIDADLSHDAYPEDRYLHYADIHSHNSMEAKFSPVDDHDEKATRLYIVLGRLDRFFPEISVRMSCGGVFHPVDPAMVLEGIGEEFPCQWLDRVRTQRQAPRHVEVFRAHLAAAFRGDEP